ncbi:MULTISPECIES: hypothetical protein [unclassified Streptomyces]|uniref:hypothetical protein n=1 Tax=unclassified Streptomyces TaxID=2593676 RepID=UPI00382B2382
MSTTRRRPLGPGQDLPDPPARDPRARTAAERAAASEWVEQLPAASQAPAVGGRRRLGAGPVDAGAADATAPVYVISETYSTDR